ncbi:SDR family oxidoreductase [Antarcticibacterium arcticum]|uniref:SDR family oxidoreductase n=1 Tax=Antarcticibacterium arcticum TaxID=2585771 RepID=A0A5B8YHY3_9FLAO|nr:SDR family oxidoreductase [Antarcticibacterium arcticum]QED36213.1 SDR family oxidoreductase [Antarcticibacterium arcticum]
MKMENNERTLVAGSTGSLGLEIVKLLREKNINVRALVLSENESSKVTPYTNDIFIGDASGGAEEIKGLTSGVTTVISALGKSVSLFTPSEDSFFETDYLANKTILEDAVKNGVKRFVYVSIKGADVEKDYSIAKAHKMFENELRASGLDYTILRPVGFFSGLNDLAILAKRKVIPVIGDGTAKTNSIHHKDLAKVVVSYRENGSDIIEVGGPNIYTRMEMAKMIENKIGGQIIKIPTPMAKIGAALPKIFSEGMHDKLDYFTFITTNDMIGEQNGSISFEEYLAGLDLNELP